MVETSVRRRRDAVENRERLLAAAGEMFAEHGLGVPLDEIARRAGVSIGTLYNNFAQREALFDAIYPARVAELDVVAETALTDPDAWQGFRRFVLHVFERQAADRGLNDVMTLRYPAAEALTEACDRGFARIDQVVTRAQQAGDLRPDFAMADLACLIWATSRVIAATEPVAPGSWRRFAEMHLDGLRARTGQSVSVPPMSTEQIAAAMRAS